LNGSTVVVGLTGGRLFTGTPARLERGHARCEWGAECYSIWRILADRRHPDRRPGWIDEFFPAVQHPPSPLLPEQQKRSSYGPGPRRTPPHTRLWPQISLSSRILASSANKRLLASPSAPDPSRLLPGGKSAVRAKGARAPRSARPDAAEHRQPPTGIRSSCTRSSTDTGFGTRPSVVR
jgi:hypothetical protein